MKDIVRLANMQRKYENSYELIMGVSKRAHQIADNHESMEASFALSEAIDELLWEKYAIDKDNQ